MPSTPAFLLGDAQVCEPELSSSTSWLGTDSGPREALSPRTVSPIVQTSPPFSREASLLPHCSAYSCSDSERGSTEAPSINTDRGCSVAGSTPDQASCLRDQGSTELASPSTSSSFSANDQTHCRAMRLRDAAQGSFAVDTLLQQVLRKTPGKTTDAGGGCSHHSVSCSEGCCPGERPSSSSPAPATASCDRRAGRRPPPAAAVKPRRPRVVRLSELELLAALAAIRSKGRLREAVAIKRENARLGREIGMLRHRVARARLWQGCDIVQSV